MDTDTHPLAPPDLLRLDSLLLPRRTGGGGSGDVGGGDRMQATVAAAGAAATASERRQLARPVLQSQPSAAQHTPRLTNGEQRTVVGSGSAGTNHGSLQQQALALQARVDLAVSHPGGPPAQTHPAAAAAGANRSHDGSPADRSGCHGQAAEMSPAATPVWPAAPPEALSDHDAVAAVEGHLAALHGSWRLPASRPSGHGHAATHHPRAAGAADGGRRKRQRHAMPVGELLHMSCT